MPDDERTDYDPSLDVTAGELRAMGSDLPEDIPDCAWIPRDKLKFNFGAATHAYRTAVPGEMVVTIPGTITFLVPLRWVTATATFTKG